LELHELDCLVVAGVLKHSIAATSENVHDNMEMTDAEQLKQLSKDVYFKMLELMKYALETSQNKSSVPTRKMKRQIMNTVSILTQDESFLLGLANLKGYDEYTFYHSVNVAIYSIAIGLRLGLSKRELTYLGVAGLFHDIGKMFIDKDIVNKKGKLSPEEWNIMRTHPLKGAEMLMVAKGWDEFVIRMITVVFEHHMKYNLSGYPSIELKRPQILFSRIIAIADIYDALGRPRVYRSYPYVSEKIISFFVEQSGKDFDPILVKALFTLIGVYPHGSLVELDTGEMGVVVRVQEDSEMLDRPIVCILQRIQDEYHKGEVVDLTKVDNDGTFIRTIQRTIDPNDYGINVVEYFV